MRAGVKITPREKGETRWGDFFAWGEFHARYTIPEEKWGLLVVYQQCDLPRIFYLGKTKAELNLRREVFDEFPLGKSV